MFGYSFAIFIPVTFFYILATPLQNLRLFILLASGIISLYYLYKESREYIAKYLDDPTLRSFGAYVVASLVFYILLFKYYFIGWKTNSS